MVFSELEAEVLKLAPEDQARLLHRLAKALEGTAEPDLTNEELDGPWQAFATGEDQGVAAEVMHSGARRRYGKS